VSVPPVNGGVASTLRAHERRLDKLEDTQPAVLAERVRILTTSTHSEMGALWKELRLVKRALWAFVIVIVVLAVPAIAMMATMIADRG